MRRFRQQLPEEEVKEILRECTNGVLSLVDEEGIPYGVPISFAYDRARTIYFHSAVSGRKIDCINSNPHCSFCVVAQDRIVPEEFTMYFRSVIIAGQLQILTDADEILRGLQLLCDKYSAGIDPTAEIAKCINHVKVMRLNIESMTGKEAIELTKAR